MTKTNASPEITFISKHMRYFLNSDKKTQTLNSNADATLPNSTSDVRHSYIHHIHILKHQNTSHLPRS